MGSQVVGKDRNRLPGRGTVGEVRGGGRRTSHKMEEGIHRFWREREEQVACHASALALAMTDEACRQAEM